jgi:Asparagine synthase
LRTLSLRVAGPLLAGRRAGATASRLSTDQDVLWLPGPWKPAVASRLRTRLCGVAGRGGDELAVVATFAAQTEGGKRVELSAASEQRCAWLGDRALVLGYFASPDGVPWSELGEREAGDLVARTLAGSAKPRGDWTLVAESAEELVIRTDSFGTRPLFWTTRGGRTSVSEDIWSLLPDRPELDPVGIADFLLVGHHLGERTSFAGISATEADCALRIGGDGASKRFLRPRPPREELADASLEASADALENSLLTMFQPYRDLTTVLVPISGGLDSRVVLAVAAEQGFALGAWTVTLIRNSEEEQLARAVAHLLDVDHTVTFSPPDKLPVEAQPFVRDTSGQLSLEHIHGYPQRLAAPDDFPVAASGIEGAPSGTFLLPRGIAPADVPRARARLLASGIDPGSLQTRLPGVPDWSDRLLRLVDDWYATVDRNPRLADYILYRNRPCRFSMFGLISRRDRFDYICPYLDEQLLSVCYGMPERWQRDATAFRRVISRRWPDLARIPWERTGLPLSRYPSRPRRRARGLRRRLGWGRPIGFTNPSLYERALRELIETSTTRLRPVFDELGIDMDSLLADNPAHRWLGRALRLRVATLYLALNLSGYHLGGGEGHSS